MAGVPIAFFDGGFAKAILRVGVNGLYAVPFRDEPFETTDRDRGVDAPAATGILAGGRAHAAAHRSKRIWSAGNEVGLLVSAFRDQLNVTPGISGDRAAGLAFDLRLPVFYPGQPDSNGHAPPPQAPQQDVQTRQL
jgi:hypothetical protein